MDSEAGHTPKPGVVGAGSEGCWQWLQAAPGALVVVGPDRRCQFANAAAVDLLHVPADELAGRPLGQLWPEGARADAVATVDQAPTGQRIVFAGPDGETAVWQIETATLPDGGVTVALRDETARWTEEQALRNANQLHTELLANMHGGIVVVDRELRIVVWNAAMEAISGLPASVVVGRPAPESL